MCNNDDDIMLKMLHYVHIHLSKAETYKVTSENKNGEAETSNVLIIYSKNKFIS